MLWGLLLRVGTQNFAARSKNAGHYVQTARSIFHGLRVSLIAAAGWELARRGLNEGGAFPRRDPGAVTIEDKRPPGGRVREGGIEDEDNERKHYVIHNRSGANHFVAARIGDQHDNWRIRSYPSGNRHHFGAGQSHLRP